MTALDLDKRPQPCRLSELAHFLRAERTLNPANPVIRSVVQDSRQVEPGALFVAVPGEKTDGHRYVAQAVKQGASALVCQIIPHPAPACPVIQVSDAREALSALAAAFHGFPSCHLRLTGVTGTDGKTSTTHILRAILEEAGRTAATIGTLGYAFADRQIDSDLTTPDPLALHRSMAGMLEAGVSDVCMEVSSHSLVLKRVAHLDFDAAVLTNITRDHLDFHVTREQYARAKRMLFEMLDPDAVAVLPAAGEFHASFADATAAQVLTYGIDELADVTGRVLSMGMDGTTMSVRTPFESYTVRTPLAGVYNCQNILAAVTAAFGFGIEGESVASAMNAFRGVPGRLERVRVPGRADLPAVVVDYAHTPGALDKVLRTLRPLVKGKLICLIGCGGDRDRTKRPIMGRIATEQADVAVFTADNSRSESTEDIIDQMVAGVSSDLAEYYVEPDRRKAIRLAICMARSQQSLVALCGRGCERYQKIGGRSIPFDDRTVAREIMSAIPASRRRGA